MIFLTWAGAVSLFSSIHSQADEGFFAPSHSLQVFSDEFEQEGRTFHDGNDPRWTALNKNDCKMMARCTG